MNENSAGASSRGKQPQRKRRTRRQRTMSDLIYIGIVVVFFALSGLYVRFCEKL
jgi:hypothetical protein